MRIITLCLFICLCFDTKSQTLKQLSEEATKAYKDKNMPLFLFLTKQQDSIRPSHPTILYNLACAYALNAKSSEAISVLKNMILMNNKVAFETDEDLASLHELTEYKALLKLKTNQLIEVKHSNKIIELSAKELHPEGITYLPKHKLWLSGSIRKHKIVSFNIKTGECDEWLTDGKLLSVFALKADAKEEFLWVATSAVPEMDNYSEEKNGIGEILKIEIKTKQIIRGYGLSGSHVFGDITIAKNGDVFISDSDQPLIYKINPVTDQLEEFINIEKEAFNLQGLTLNEDESALYIADYLKGILKINLKDATQRTWLDFPEGTTRKGIDGLVFYKNSLIAIHNGIKPIRIIKYDLNKEGTHAIKATVIDHARQEFMEPTLATLIGSELYFIANSPWSCYTKDFQLDESKLRSPLLYRFKIEK
ncbi:MAG: hypothetical protein V4677_04070 [Bacteroidota bacterium]